MQNSEITSIKAPRSASVSGMMSTPEESNALAISPLDLSPDLFRQGLDRRKQNRTTLMEWIRSALVEDRDFGSIMIRGQKSKPSLLKPGAEKITGMLGLIPRFPNLHEYEQSALSGKTVDQIILKCELQNQAGEVIGEGVGARSCEKQDNGDLNKSLKMASKSAMIDATLRCAGISEVFTQDIEEMQQVEAYRPSPDSTKTQEVVVTDPPSEKQERAVYMLLENHKVTQDEKRKIHDILDKGLSKGKATEILTYFFGESQRVDGDWVKVNVGALDGR